MRPAVTLIPARRCISFGPRALRGWGKETEKDANADSQTPVQSQGSSILSLSWLWVKMPLMLLLLTAGLRLGRVLAWRLLRVRRVPASALGLPARLDRVAGWLVV